MQIQYIQVEFKLFLWNYNKFHHEWNFKIQAEEKDVFKLFMLYKSG